MKYNSEEELRKLLIQPGDNLLSAGTHNKFVIGLQENLDWAFSRISNIRTQLGIPETSTADTIVYSESGLFAIQNGQTLEEAIAALDAIVGTMLTLLNVGLAGMNNLEVPIPPSTLTLLKEGTLFISPDFTMYVLRATQMLDGTIVVVVGNSTDGQTWALRLTPSFAFTAVWQITSFQLGEASDLVQGVNAMGSSSQWGDLLLFQANNNIVEIYAKYAQNIISPSPEVWENIGQINFSAPVDHLSAAKRYKSDSEFDVVILGHIPSLGRREIYRSTDVEADWDQCWNDWSLADTIPGNIPSSLCVDFYYNMMIFEVSGSNIKKHQYSNFDLSDDPTTTGYSISGIEGDTERVKAHRSTLPFHYTIAVSDNIPKLYLYVYNTDLEEIYLADTIEDLYDSTSWDMVQLNSSQVALFYLTDNRNVKYRLYYWSIK